LIDLQTAFNNKHKVQTQGGNVGGYLEFFHSYYISQKALIENQRKIVEGLTRILEEKRQFLIHAAKEHKTFTMLKQKKKEEFKKEMKKREQKRIDDINIMRQGKAI